MFNIFTLNSSESRKKIDFIIYIEKYIYFMVLFAIMLHEILEMFSSLPIFVRIIMVLFFIIAAALIFLIGHSLGRFSESRKSAGISEEILKDSRKDAVKRSRAVIGGQMVEQIAPFLPGFPCNPGDVRFVGKPIDFIGFPGAAAGEPIQEILLIEIKTGTSALSRREREIKKAVKAGKVRYLVYRNGNVFD